MNYNTGDRVRLIDATKLKKYGLSKGMKGWCNALTTVPGEGDYLYFMPDGTRQVFIIEASRAELDEEED